MQSKNLLAASQQIRRRLPKLLKMKKEKLQQNKPFQKKTVNPLSLNLSLKTKWFDLTKAGIKTEDYRELNSYWFKRLVFDWKKVSKYYNIDPSKNIEIQLLCCDFFWSKTIAFKPFDINIMTLGYPKSSNIEKILKLNHKGIEIRTGNPNWGAEPGKRYFVIKHGVFLA